VYVSHCECEEWLVSAPIIVSSLSLVPFIDIHKPLLSKPLLNLTKKSTNSDVHVQPGLLVLA